MATVMYEITNNDTSEYVEEFKEKEIRIPAGRSIIMPKSEANQFLAKLAVDKHGRLKPKMLSSKRIGAESENEMICNFCGKSDFKTRDEFLLHLNTHAKARYKDESLDKEITRKEIEEKPFKCSFCEFRCANEYSMKRHIETQHFLKRKGSQDPEDIKDGSDADADLQSGSSAGGRK